MASIFKHRLLANNVNFLQIIGFGGPIHIQELEGSMYNKMFRRNIDQKIGIQKIQS